MTIDVQCRCRSGSLNVKVGEQVEGTYDGCSQRVLQCSTVGRLSLALLEDHDVGAVDVLMKKIVAMNLAEGQGERKGQTKAVFKRRSGTVGVVLRLGASLQYTEQCDWLEFLNWLVRVGWP